MKLILNNRFPKKYLFLFVLTCLSFSLSAQVSEEDDDSVTVHAFKFKVLTSNNQLSRGHKMGTNMLDINPTFQYCYKDGFYANVFSGYFPSLVLSKLDDVGAGIGYNLDFWEDFNTYIEYSYTHYASFRQINSSAPHILTWSLDWDNDFISPNFELDYLAGITKDICTTLTFSHSFSYEKVFTEKDKLSIPISISGTVGTSHFYQAYVNNNVVVKKKNKNAILTPEEINTSFAFNLLDISLSAEYEIGDLTLTPSISYDIPINQVTGLNSSGYPIFSLEIGYSF